MKNHLKSEQGSIILFVMVAILVISVYGISSLKSSSNEMMIARNHRCYKQNMYRAEAAVMEAAQVLQQESEPKSKLKPETTDYEWLADGSKESMEFDPEKQDWEAGNSKNSELFEDNESAYVVVFDGIAQGSSLNMTNDSHVWQYQIYGQSELCMGAVGVEAGYRRRF